MSEAIVSGDPKRFAFQVIPDVDDVEYAEVACWLDGSRVGSRDSVFLGTFVYHLEGVLRTHEHAQHPSLELGRLSPRSSFRSCTTLCTASVAVAEL